MKVVVEIMPRPEALDPQGRAIEAVLTRMGHQLKDCRAGKIVVLDLPYQDSAQALKVADQMAKDVLVNELIETYQVRAQ